MEGRICRRVKVVNWKRRSDHNRRVGFDAVVPNPKLKLLEQVREIMRLQVVDG